MVCDGVVAAGVLLGSAMVIWPVITWSARVISRLVCVLVVVHAFLGVGSGVDLVGAAVFLGIAPLLDSSLPGSLLCCFVSTESKLLCGLRLDLVGRGWCLT